MIYEKLSTSMSLSHSVIYWVTYLAILWEVHAVRPHGEWGVLLFFGKQMYHPKHTCTRTCTHLHVYMHIYFQWIPDILKHQIKYQSMMILLHVQNRKIKIKSINLYVPLSYCLRAVLPKVVTRWPLPVVLSKVLVRRISRENWEKSKKFKKWNISMCETGVSTMSIIKTNHRNSLDIRPSLREAVYTRRPGFFYYCPGFSWGIPDKSAGTLFCSGFTKWVSLCPRKVLESLLCPRFSNSVWTSWTEM